MCVCVRGCPPSCFAPDERNKPSNNLEFLAKIARLCNAVGTPAKGYITVEVLRDILHELDDKIPPGDLDLMIAEIDADGSGTVDFQGI